MRNDIHFLVQWIGNSVTCKSWDQIWLNEGFADYFLFHGVQQVESIFKPLEMRQFEGTQVALEFDAGPSDPLINTFKHNGETDHSFESYFKVFNRISYQKGSSLLRMLEAILTPAAFKKAVNEYIAAKCVNKIIRNFAQFTIQILKCGFIRELQAADQDELFTHFQNNAGWLPDDLTVKEVMDTWSLQNGFPLVRVTKASNKLIFLSQVRCIL